MGPSEEFSPESEDSEVEVAQKETGGSQPVHPLAPSPESGGSEAETRKNNDESWNLEFLGPVCKNPAGKER